MAEHGADGAEAERPAIFRLQGFGQTPEDPRQQEPLKPKENDKNPAPWRDKQDQLSKAWRDDGRDDGNGHGHGHDARHLASPEKIAHKRDGHDAACRGRYALKRAAGNKQGIGRCDNAHQCCGEKSDQRPHENGAPPEPVGEGTVKKLRRAGRKHENRNNELAIVIVDEAEVGADIAKRGEHHVDGERGHRHDGGDKAHKLHFGKRRALFRQGCRGAVHNSFHKNGTDCCPSRASCAMLMLRPTGCNRAPISVREIRRTHVRRIRAHCRSVYSRQRARKNPSASC